MVKERTGSFADSNTRTRKFLILFVIGLVIIFIGVVVVIVAALLSGDLLDFGVVVIIGFFPIVVGVGSEKSLTIFFAMILVALGIIMFLLMRRKAEKMGS